RRAQALVAAAMLQGDVELAMGPRQGDQGGDQGDPAAATVALLVLLAVLQQLRIEAETGIDQKIASVDLTQTDVFQTGVEQVVHRLAGVLGNAMGAAEIV